ncbi:MAG: OmpA family protein [Candidatus Marivariicella sp.]
MIRKIEMKYRFILMLLLLIGGLTYAQIEVNGVVKDEKTNTPLEEVRIQLKPISNKGAGYWTGTMTKENGKYRVSTTMSLPAVISYQKQGCGKKSIKIKKGDEVPQEVFLDCTDEAIKAIIIEQTLDTDGDGLVDKNDKCPKEFGTEENEGCPDKTASEENLLEEKDELNSENDTKKEKYIKSDVEKMIASNIYFELNLFSINPAERSKLNDIKNLLNSFPDIKIDIVGHASSDGPSDYNMLLSEKRANMVKMTLNNLGIDSSRLKVSFSGENEPTSSNISNKGKSKNRRVEISIQ